jgi:hypothetical protein
VVNTLRRAAACSAYGGLVLVSLLMIWDTRAPDKFVAFFGRPARDYLQDADLIVVPTVVVLFGRTLFELVRGRKPITTRIIRALLMLAWCLLLAMCCLLMGVRTGIV